MHAEIQKFWEINRMYTPLRDDLLKNISDADLTRSPGGVNPSLGDLCRELGETQMAYIESFKSFKTDFSIRVDAAEYGTVAALRAWYADLDEQLEAALQAITEDDLAAKQIDRGGYHVPIPINLDIFREALLIFYGKVSVYAKATGLPLTQMWKDWIA